jgi:polyhydroxybutyrate depolymerase
MRALGLALTVLLVLAAGASAEVRELRVRVGGELRTYRLFEPSAAPRQTVVMFHGGGSSGEGQASISGFDAVAERERWAVAYPDGMGGHWNSGPCCAGRSQRRDDVRFFDALLGDLARRGLPARRVAIAGFSDGGFFAYRLACQRTRRLRAVAAVATTMMFRPCRPSGPLRVTSVWMELDRLVPPAGRDFAGIRLPGAQALSRFWRRTNRCALLTRGQTPMWTVDRGRRCAAGYAAYIVAGAGHGWPPVATDLVTAALRGASFASGGRLP